MLDSGSSRCQPRGGNCDAETETRLIESGASVNLLTESWDSCRHSALLEATRHGHTEVVKILLQRGAMVDLSGTRSPSALSIAARNGYANGDSEIVSVLIESGANVNLLSYVPVEYSALYAAARHANAQIVLKLIRAGADVDLLVNGRCQTALMRAA